MISRPALALLALPLLLAARPVAGQFTTGPAWIALESAPVAASGRHDDITFISEQIGWLVNTRGEAWQTADGGASWSLKWGDRSVAFRSVAFTDEDHGWIGTVFNPGEPLWETQDGGDTWTASNDRISGPLPAGICGLSAVGPNHVFGVGAFHGEPAFIRTEDGGLSWDSFDMRQHAGALIDVHFVDEFTGFATGGSGANLNGNAVILKTSNGGFSWRKVYESRREAGVSGEWGWKITFPTDRIGYVSVETLTNTQSRPAKIIKTSDGGEKWSEVRVSGSVERAGLQGVGFLTPSLGWASGRGTTSVTLDGGDHWTQVQPYNPDTGAGQLDGSVNRFVVVGDSLVYAIGQRVYRLDLRRISTTVDAFEPLPEAFVLGSAYPNPFRGRATLPFSLTRDARVRISIIDVGGRKHRSLISRAFPPGRHEVVWDGLDDRGRHVPSGRYIVLLDIGDSMEMKQVVRVR